MKKYCFIFLFNLFLFGCASDNFENIDPNNHRIVGESFVLSNTTQNHLIKKRITNLILYSIGSNRERIYYKENVDYVVNQNRINRTLDSSIPDFSNHIVYRNVDDTFTFSSSPRNPSLTIPFHVYADYDFQDVETVFGKFNEGFLSPRFKDKLKNKKIIKIGTIGTSITAGAHTMEQFYHDSDSQTYPYLTAKALKNVYGSDCFVTNYSKSGSSIGHVFNSIPQILKDKNDVVFIEFGMNDHINYNWDIGLNDFKKNMDVLIKMFKGNDTEVILVGFFQQNPSWDLEFVGSTVRYNEVINNLAVKYDCYFADIYKEFSKYSQSKINQDLCGDFIHHPTSFGHLLYYKTIIPLFLDKELNDGFVYNLLD